jgi:hypothetical protein
MAEERRAERAGYKADGVDAERLQRSDQRVGRGEIQFRENQRGNEHVEQEIIRLDHRADGRGDNGAAQLHAVLSIGQVFGRNPGCRHRVSPRDVHSRRPEPSWALYGEILSRRPYGNKSRRSAPQSRFAAPLFTTLLSIVILKEKVGIHRWSALIVGFVGVLIITHPGAGTLTYGALFALGNAVLISTVAIAIRRMSMTESTETLTLYQMSIMTLCTAGC